MNTSIPILMYHEVIEDDLADTGLFRKMKKSYFVKKSLFDKQMQYLAKNGFCALNLNELVEYVKGPQAKELPGKCLVLTFDDGYSGNHRNALPVLKGYSLSATFFVTTGLVGKKYMMGWNELKSLVDSGMSVQSHTLSHPFLKGLDDSGVKNELEGSKKVLEGNLGSKVDFLSLPHGSWGKNFRQIAVDSGYLGCCSSIEGFNDASSDLYLLKRINISGGYGLSEFIKIVNKDQSFVRKLALKKAFKDFAKTALGEGLYDKLYNTAFGITKKNE